MKNICKTIFHSIFFLLVIPFLSACGHGGDNSAEEVVDSFSVAYFNHRYVDALRYATNDSHRWLSFAASQVTQEDVDSLRAMSDGAETKIEDVSYKDDTTAEAIVTVRNYLSLDSVGKHPYIVAKRKFTIPLVLRGDKWQVNLTMLPEERK